MQQSYGLACRRWAVAAVVLGAIASTLGAGHYRWTTTGPEPGFVFQIVVNPQNSDRLQLSAGYYGQLLFQTADRGETWAQNEDLVSSGRLVQDPSNGSVLYTTGYSGAVWGVLKTVDGGESWFPAQTGLPSSPAVSALAVAPSAPGMLYAVISGSPGQVFRSVDGAASWTIISSDFPAQYVGDLAVDPSNPSTIYAAAGLLLLKSVDGGATWLSLPPNDAGRIAIDPVTPSTIYVGTSAAGVLKSTDGGATWAPANVGIENSWVRDLALDPTNPQRLWMAGGTSPAEAGGIFVTSNGGQTWSLVDLGVPVILGTAIAVDPRNPSLVYAAAASLSVLRGGFYASSDGGATWTVREKGLSGYYSYAVASDPAIAGRAHAVSGANVFRTDAGEVGWTLRGTAAYGLTSLVADPSDGNVLYGAFVTPEPGGDGVVRSADGGVSWNPATQGLSVSLIHRLAISLGQPTHLLAATFDGLLDTSDGGGLWAPLLSGDIRAAAFDPADASILYAGIFAGANQNGLLRSDDGGTNWSAPSGLPTSYLRVSDIAIPGNDPSAVYVAVGSSGSGLYRSTDRGLSFVPANTGLPGGLQAPDRLVVDPTNPSRLYLATVPGGAAAPTGGNSYANVFRTSNAADSWSPLPGFLPAWYPLDFQINANGRILYASTLSGVFQFERSFLDVADTDPFWPSIDGAAMNGVTAGCGGGNFCPVAPTSRASAAVFLLRGKNGAAFAPPPATGTVFGDVSADSLAADFIEELYRLGVTAGCGGGDYCPGDSVSRAQMAVLLLKMEHGIGFAPPPATGAVFADVPADAFAADWIEQLFAEGITAGCGSGNFCPDAPVSRAQAAALVVRAFGLS